MVVIWVSGGGFSEEGWFNFNRSDILEKSEAHSMPWYSITLPR